MHTLRVGQLYDPRRRSWPEGAAWIFHEGRYELLLRFARPSAQEVEAVGAGSGAVAFFEHEGILLGLYRFGETAIQWSDVPMDPSRWSERPTGEQAPIALVLLDAATGIVRALRLILLPEAFSTALAAAVSRAPPSLDPKRWAAGVAAAEAAFSSEEMAKLASHVAEHGPKGPAARA